MRKELKTSVSSIPVEYASERKIRTRNKLYYRFNHWPIWIFVFFIAPGPLTFDLFERGFDGRMVLWLGARAARDRHRRRSRASCRASSPRPTSSDSPRIGRTRSTGASATRLRGAPRSRLRCSTSPASSSRSSRAQWYLKQIYRYAYFPIAGTIWLLGALGRLPRVMPSTKGEGHERRYFYGTVWAMCIAQPALWLMWYVLPNTRVGNSLKLAIFLGIIAFVGNLARLGRLPRTRPIVPGELAVSD